MEEAGRIQNHLLHSSWSSQTHSGRKGPLQRVPTERPYEETWRSWLGMVALCKIYQYQMSTEFPIHKHSFACLICDITQDCGKYNLYFQVHVVMALQEAAEYYLTCLLEDANLYHPHEMHYNYAQRHSVSPSYLWRPSSFLNACSSLSLFQVSVDCKLCWDLPV